jgi:hypothetical protein
MCGVGAVLSACFPRILKRTKAVKHADNASSAPTLYSGALKGGCVGVGVGVSVGVGVGVGAEVGFGDGEGVGMGVGVGEEVDAGEGEEEGEGEGELLLRTAIGVPVSEIAAKVPTTVWGDWNSVGTETHLPWVVL